MSDQTIEQLSANLRANQIAVDVARKQRNDALDEIAALNVMLDQANTRIQAMAGEAANLRVNLEAAEALTVDLKAQLAVKAARAKK